MQSNLVLFRILWFVVVGLFVVILQLCIVLSLLVYIECLVSRLWVRLVLGLLCIGVCLGLLVVFYCCCVVETMKPND